MRPTDLRNQRVAALVAATLLILAGSATGQSDRLVRILSGHSGAVTAVAFSPDGKTVASGSADKTVKLWEVASGRLLRTLSGHSQGVTAVSFSSDGRSVASGSADGTVKIWDVGSGALVLTLRGHSGTVNSVAFSHDGQVLLSGSDDKSIRVWNVSSGNTIRVLQGHTGAVRCVAVSSDGKLFVSGGEDGTVRLWDANLARMSLLGGRDAAALCIRVLSSVGGGVTGVAVSQSGDLVVCGARDRAVRIYSRSSGALLRTISGPTDAALGVAVSPDGKKVACGGRDSNIYVWDSYTGASLALLAGHRGAVNSVAFSPDGQLLASGSDDTTVRLWNTRLSPVALFAIYPTNPMVGQRVQFDASGSYAREGVLVSYIWTFGDGTGGVGRIVEKTYAVSGSFTVLLQVTDSAGGSATATRTVAVLPSNAPPVAYFDFSPASPQVGHVITFAAHGSSDPDGVITSYTWAFGDGTTGTGKVVEKIYAAAGVYTVTLTVTDNLGATANTRRAITVSGENIPPVATFTWEVLAPEGTRLLVQPRTGDRIRFDASGSKDPDGRITKYEWDWTSDGTYDLTTTDPVVEYRFPTPGSHKVTLRVTDDKGATATTSQVVGIGEKKPPVADFTFSPSSPSILDTVQFTDRSTDPDGQVTSWRWEFGDGTTSSEKNPTKKYNRKGSFTVKLTVTDNDGQSASTTKTVTVVNLPPEAFFTFSPKDPYAGAEITFDASGSGDKDGTIRSYAWDFTGDGAPNKEGPKVTWTFPSPGTYPVTLTVTDDDGAKATSKDTLVVTLSPQPVEARRVWALVVGISVYRESSLNLRYARKDAEAFSRWLTETARVPKDQVQVLLDDQATLVEVRLGLDWLRRRAEEDDLVVFYFAGHGYQGADLPPIDEKDGLDEYFVLYDTKRTAIEATALRDDEFGQLFDRLRSKYVLIVFDSCHAGGGERGDRGLPRGARPVGDRYDIWGDFRLEGRIVLAASKEDQKSYEHPELGQGVFTYFLLDGVRGRADENGDGQVTIQEVYGYVAREVPKYVRDKMGEAQEPQMIGFGTPQVVLAKANRPPTVEFSFAPELPFPGGIVRFEDRSVDDGNLTSWHWEFGDGLTSALRNPQHTYPRPGSYEVKLTVTDDGGLRSTATRTLTVGPYGEVTAVDLSRNLVTINLGSRNGVQIGDRFEVVHVIVIPDGTELVEVRALVEVVYLSAADRAVCRVAELNFPVSRGDRVRLRR